MNIKRWMYNCTYCTKQYGICNDLLGVGIGIVVGVGVGVGVEIE